MAKNVKGDLVILDAAAQMEGQDRSSLDPRSAPNFRALGTFTAAATDIVTMADHGFSHAVGGLDGSGGGAVGGPVRCTTSAADLPAGLAINTDYWYRTIDQNTFKLYATEAAAQANGTAVDITDTGSGTHTLNAQNVYQFPIYIDEIKVDTGAGGDVLVTIGSDSGDRQLKLDSTPANDTLWVPIRKRVRSIYAQTLPAGATLEVRLGADNQ
jgi:hypothetical protein